MKTLAIQMAVRPRRYRGSITLVLDSAVPQVIIPGA